MLVIPDNVEVFEMTAVESAAMQEDLIYEYMKRPEYRRANFNTKARDALLTAIVENESISGGWFYWYCQPGCLPDSNAIGPYDSRDEAIRAAIDDREGMEGQA